MCELESISHALDDCVRLVVVFFLHCDFFTYSESRPVCYVWLLEIIVQSHRDIRNVVRLLTRPHIWLFPIRGKLRFRNPTPVWVLTATVTAEASAPVWKEDTAKLASKIEKLRWIYHRKNTTARNSVSWAKTKNLFRTLPLWVTNQKNAATNLARRPREPPPPLRTKLTTPKWRPKNVNLSTNISSNLKLFLSWQNENVEFVRCAFDVIHFFVCPYSPNFSPKPPNTENTAFIAW